MRMQLALGVLSIIVLAGCGSDRVPTYLVSGKVMFEDGSPVKYGTIEAESQHGTTATGTIQTDGTFVLGTYESDDGAAEGSNNVIVMQLISADVIQKHQKDHGAPIDPIFASYDTSSVTIEVKPVEQNQVTITVTKQNVEHD